MTVVATPRTLTVVEAPRTARSALLPPPTASRDDAVWLYRQIIRQHEEAPRVRTYDPSPTAALVDPVGPAWRSGCAHCPPDGGECRYLVWAHAELAAELAAAAG